MHRSLATQTATTQTDCDLPYLLSLEQESPGQGITYAISNCTSTTRGISLLSNLWTALGNTAKDRMTPEHLTLIIANRPVLAGGKERFQPVNGDDYLLNIFLARANRTIITSEHLDFAVQQAVTGKSISLLSRLFMALGETAGSKITREHLSKAVSAESFSTLSFLVKTLWERVENRDKAKTLLNDLFVKSSDEKTEVNEINKDFISEFLIHIIEMGKNDILKIVLNILGEHAENIIQEKHLNLAIRDDYNNIDRLTLLLKTLGAQNKERTISFLEKLTEETRSKILKSEIRESGNNNQAGLIFFLNILDGQNRMFNIEFLHLEVALRNPDPFAFESLLNALTPVLGSDEKAKDLLSKCLDCIIMTDDKIQSKLQLFLTLLGENAKNVIKENHLTRVLDNSDALQALLKSSGEKSSDIIDIPLLSQAARRENPEPLKIILNSLSEEKKQDMEFMSTPLSIAIHDRRLDSVKYLVSALGEHAKNKITQDTLSQALNPKNHDVAKYLVDVLGQNARNIIAPIHLHIACNNNDRFMLSLLLSILVGKQDENEDKDEDQVKSLVQELTNNERSKLLAAAVERAAHLNEHDGGLEFLLNLSDNDQRMIEIKEEHLTIAIENEDAVTLTLLLNSSGEAVTVNQMLSVHLEQAVRQADKDNSSKLNFLLTTLDANAEHMITRELLSLAKQINPAAYQSLRQCVKSSAASSAWAQLFSGPLDNSDSKEGDINESSSAKRDFNF